MGEVNVNYYNKDWVISSHQVTNDNGQQNVFFFTVPENSKGKNLYFSVDFIPGKMYQDPFSKKPKLTSIQFLDQKLGVIQNSQFFDDDDYGFTNLTDLKPGTYTFKIQVTWQQGEVRDYAIGIYAQDKYDIFNVYGGANFTDIGNLNAQRDIKLKEVMGLLDFSGQTPREDVHDKRITLLGKGTSQTAK